MERREKPRNSKAKKGLAVALHCVATMAMAKSGDEALWKCEELPSIGKAGLC